MDALALLCNLHADGPETLHRLRRAGASDIGALLELEPARLESALGRGAGAAQRFLREARLLGERLGIEEVDAARETIQPRGDAPSGTTGRGAGLEPLEPPLTKHAADDALARGRGDESVDTEPTRPRESTARGAGLPPVDVPRPAREESPAAQRRAFGNRGDGSGEHGTEARGNEAHWVPADPHATQERAASARTEQPGQRKQAEDPVQSEPEVGKPSSSHGVLAALLRAWQRVETTPDSAATGSPTESPAIGGEATTSAPTSKAIDSTPSPQRAREESARGWGLASRAGEPTQESRTPGAASETQRTTARTPSMSEPQRSGSLGRHGERAEPQRTQGTPLAQLAGDDLDRAALAPLSAAGITTLEEFVAADPRELSERSGLRYTQLLRLQYVARRRARG